MNLCFEVQQTLELNRDEQYSSVQIKKASSGIVHILRILHPVTQLFLVLLLKQFQCWVWLKWPCLKNKQKTTQDRKKTLSSASRIFSADKLQMKSVYLPHNTHKEGKKEVQEDKVLCTHTHTHIHACTHRGMHPPTHTHTHKHTCMLEPVFILTLSKPVFWFEQKKKKNLLQMNKQIHVIPKTRIVHTVHKLCINKMVHLQCIPVNKCVLLH